VALRANTILSLLLLPGADAYAGNSPQIRFTARQLAFPILTFCHIQHIYILGVNGDFVNMKLNK
jgi:hypothetical protein